jgi:hypothetical protein
MKIIEKIDDITGYIYVIEFDSTDIDTGEVIKRRVDVKYVCDENIDGKDVDPYYYIMEPGVYYVDENKEPVFVESNIKETQLLNQAIRTIIMQGIA